MQSETGLELLKEHGLSDGDFDTFAYIQHGTPYIKSTAALRVARELGGAWKLLYGLIIIPEKVRDYLYSVVATNRYKWFGKRDSCMVPTPELKDRFL